VVLIIFNYVCINHFHLYLCIINLVPHIFFETWHIHYFVVPIIFTYIGVSPTWDHISFFKHDTSMKAKHASCTFEQNNWWRKWKASRTESSNVTRKWTTSCPVKRHAYVIFFFDVVTVLILCIYDCCVVYTCTCTTFTFANHPRHSN
jgi:hypothetical protein